MPQLRRSRLTETGFGRRRRGRGFSYTDPDGAPVREEPTLTRIRELVIPPAWRDVWISPFGNDHIQVVGTDAAGRRQYLYHEAWRRQRDQAKHERVLELARRLPAARETVLEHLSGRGLTRQRVLACAVRLLDLGFFRIGGEEYAEENGTYGLATLRREHVSVTRAGIEFDYDAKGSQHRVHAVVDTDVQVVVRALLARKDPGPELLAYWADRSWHDVRSDDINRYLRDIAGEDVSAKDFRTWHATVLCVVALSRAKAATTVSGRKRTVSAAVKEVAGCLGNTPSVCRKSYIDPRALDRYDDGDLARVTLQAPAELSLAQLAARPDVEEAVIDLLAPST
ncbi:MAG: DNA topoisomerase IB [Geodermatophilaceae bacterium]